MVEDLARRYGDLESAPHDDFNLWKLDAEICCCFQDELGHVISLFQLNIRRLLLLSKLRNTSGLPELNERMEGWLC